MTSDLLATLSRSTPWAAGVWLSGFNRLSTKHRRLSHSVLLFFIAEIRLFELCSYHCLVWVEWFRSEINQCSFLLFLALSCQTQSSFSWPCPSFSPSSVAFFHCASSPLFMLTCTVWFFLCFFLLVFPFQTTLWYETTNHSPLQKVTVI